jgi:hypothetical protein
MINLRVETSAKMLLAVKLRQLRIVSAQELPDHPGTYFDKTV